MENEEPLYYMGEHFSNDATWNCKDNQRNNLPHSNNCHWNGLLMKAKAMILPGGAIKIILKLKCSSKLGYKQINLLLYKYLKNPLKIVDIYFSCTIKYYHLHYSLTISIEN